MGSPRRQWHATLHEESVHIEAVNELDRTMAKFECK
jgi:hypothetical protein